MNRYLSLSIAHFAIGLFASSFIGCANQATERQVTCVPTSIVSAWTMAQSGYKVRIAVRNVKPGVDHSQAEALIDGEWVPLTTGWDANRGLIIKTWVAHFDVEPYRYVSLDKWVKEQGEFVR